MAFTASTPGQGALPLHRHSQLQAGVGGRNAEAGAMEAAGRDSFSAFYLFPQPSGKATPDNGRQRAHGRELSPRVALGATKLEQPMLAGLQPREMLAPAKSILYSLFHATTLPGSMSKHL